MMEARLFAIQRLTAMILAPLVLIHVAGILYAIEGGLTAAEILGRTRGSIGWALFYGLFVVCAALHGAIGLRNILIEWARLPRRAANPAMLAFAVLLLALGLRAVGAVT
ncbi:succinate dehydrogenase [Rhodobacteraceae bacterium NNCM2]|nr:succinate dehydrogenase [Coraliihabitans acroporae]